ncbi:hypothetical protein MICRO8M_150002 [Microbacterium sp. 8M]|nr:hypothetical protein MICRO8M_150002 [Microbacterium sp. 8M]
MDRRDRALPGTAERGLTKGDRSRRTMGARAIRLPDPRRLDSRPEEA